MKKIISLLLVLSIIMSMFLTFGTFASGELLFYSFEDENEGWNVWSSAGKHLNSLTQDCATDGKKSLLINDNSEGLAGGISTKMVEVKEGITYSVSADVLLVHGTINVSLRFYDKDEKRLTNTNKKTAVGKWENAVITEVAPSGAKYANIVIATTAAAKAIGYFDNIFLKEGALSVKTISAKLPDKLPVLTADESIVKPTEDGVEDGAELLSESFEGGLGNWTYSTANSKDYVKVVSETFSDGNSSVHINDIGDVAGPGIKSPMIKVSQGNTYTILLDFKGISGTIKVYTKFFDQSNTALSQPSINAPIGDWQETYTYVDAPNAYGTMLREEIALVIDDNFNFTMVLQALKNPFSGKSLGQWMKMPGVEI